MNSPLVTYTHICPHKEPRNHKIDTISIHCVVGQCTAQSCCDYFAFSNRKASSNYVIGRDGSIGLSVPENYRSFCTSSSSNDHRAVTIEVASDTAEPYAITPQAWNSLIQLLVDICKRNGIPKLLWKADKSLIGQIDQQNMTVHRWFAAKACPGEYLYSRHGLIADAVNAQLEKEEEELTQEQFNQMMRNYLEYLSEKPATWDQAACDWATANGLFQGNEKGQIMPKKFLTRGELATVLQRLVEQLEK